MQPQVVWDEFLKIAKEDAGSQVVETWFKAVQLEQIDQKDESVSLKMPNSFVSKWIQEHYLSLLKTNLNRLLHFSDVTIRFIDPAKQHESEMQKKQTSEAIQPEKFYGARNTDYAGYTKPTVKKNQYLPAQVDESKQGAKPGQIETKHSVALPEFFGQNKKRSTLNPSYRFDSFIVGPSNSLAHGAAYAVSQNLGHVYNPLFIYGGTGLGKTHLLHAIGNEVKSRNPNLKVRYETSDQFMHEFIRSIRFDRAHQFRERYKNADLFLVDDIQFFSKKEQTQETFFHIFNMLHEQKKQIVLSSDTFPEEIKGLQNRLKSRMEWGLVADMQTPDLETKVAILSKKAETHNITLNNDVSHFIASRVRSNIRQLEGALIRIDAFASLTGQTISLDLAQRVLLQFQEQKKENLDLESVAQVIAKHYSVSVSEIKSKRRSKNIALVRQLACYLMKKITPHSLQTIGVFFGGRDHSTIIHAINRVEKQIKTDGILKQKLNAIEQEILAQ